jgi:N-terminal acetyltransferase B complex non-catalytic subunit
MDKILKDLEDFESFGREIYRSFIVPLYKQPKKELIQTLSKISFLLEDLAQMIIDRSRKYNLQEAKEVNIQKLKLFSEDFFVLSKKIQREIYLEENKKEVESDLIVIKEEITKPEKYFRIEEDTKNILNIFFDYLLRTKEEIKYKFQDVNKQRRSVDELLTILNKKDEKIKELNEDIKKYELIDAQHKVKQSKLSSLETDLFKQTKVSEQELTILNIHILQIEKELTSLFKNIRTLSNDIANIEQKFIKKEQLSLELIKELKDELLSTRYLLSKRR